MSLAPHLDPANLAKLSSRDLRVLIERKKWLNTARPKQLPPDIVDHGNGIDLDWTEWGLLSGRGFGKLCDVETPVPTPEGWRRLGDLTVGDRVFDEAGVPCTVLKTFDDAPDIAYRLTFSDNTFIDACSEHQWVTWTHRDRKEYLRHHDREDFPENWPAHRQVLPKYGDVVGPEVRTTQEVVDTLRQDTKRQDLNHCVPVCGDLHYPERIFVLDPWLLGYWLGNGSKDAGLVSCHQDDFDEVRQRFTEWGFPSNGMVSGRPSFYARNLMVTLRDDLGVLGNKHVPRAYMEASVAQRRSLLAGLLDSDGYCDPTNGQIEFCSIDRCLADAVVELARSLGQKPIFATGRAMLNGVDHGEKYRVTWRPTYQPFELPRKAAAWRKPASQALRNRHRMIVSAERIEPKPMRCLTVDSTNHMFLIGEGMIPTHNSLTGAQWLWHEAIMDPQALPSAVIAPTLNDVRYTCFEGVTGLLSVAPPEIIKDYNKTNLIVTLDTGAVIRGFSAEEPERLRGPQFGRVWGDEVAAWVSDQDTFDMMMFGLRLGDNPRFVWTTTPKPKDLIRKLVEKKSHRHITAGSTYENRANLARSFFDQLVQYEGTQLGRQELEGEIIDAEEGAIIARKWLKLWPANRPIPALEFVICSMDTAFTEKSQDRRSHDPDPTACIVLGLFWNDEAVGAVSRDGDTRVRKGRMEVLLMDCWDAQVGFPELIRKAKREMTVAYGDDLDRPTIKPLVGPRRMGSSGRKPDILLIEDKGSGISLRQALEQEGVASYPYNPGHADKTSRLHMVSHLFAQGLVWIPESERLPGRFKTWTQTMVAQLCSFRGVGSTKHDDYIDVWSQGLAYLNNKGLLMTTTRKRANDTADREDDPAKRQPRMNPYAV